MAAISAQVLQRKESALRGVEPIAPLDDHRALIQELVKAQIHQLGTRLEAIEVDVRELNAAGVDAHQLEGWAGDVSCRSRASGDAPDERRLARPEVAFEKQEIPLPQAAAESFAGRFGFLWRAGDQVKQSGRSRPREAEAASRRRPPP